MMQKENKAEMKNKNAIKRVKKMKKMKKVPLTSRVPRISKKNDKVIWINFYFNNQKK